MVYDFGQSIDALSMLQQHMLKLSSRSSPAVDPHPCPARPGATDILDATSDEFARYIKAEWAKWRQGWPNPAP